MRDTINRGLTWLLKCRNQDGSWFQTPHQSGSAVQTSVALLALTAPPGLFRQYSEPVVQGRNWLLKNLDNREGAVDNYEVPRREQNGNIIGYYRRISHVSFPEGTILQALLTCGVDLTDKRLTGLVKSLVDAQARDGSWKSFGFAYEEPIFAIQDACLALNSFTLQVKSNERTLDIRENLLEVKERIDVFQVVQETINAELDKVRSSLKSLTEKDEQRNKVIQDFKEFHSGLFWLRPVAFVGNRVRRYPLIAFLIAVVLINIVLKVSFSIDNKWVDLSTGVATALYLLVELLQYYRSKRR